MCLSECSFTQIWNTALCITGRGDENPRIIADHVSVNTQPLLHRWQPLLHSQKKICVENWLFCEMGHINNSHNNGEISMKKKKKTTS